MSHNRGMAEKIPGEVLSVASSEDAAIYSALVFPPPPSERPYTFINMVSTIDGKTVSGERDQPVMDLGSKIDHEIMRQIEGAADAIMVGAGSLRATPGLWYPKDKIRIVVTKSARLDFGSRFFSDAPEKAIVAGSRQTIRQIGQIGLIGLIEAGEEELDLIELMRELRTDRGIERLLVEGGSELNATLLEADMVDELFLTLAPKIKLGRETPTYAGGDPLPRQRIQKYHLVEHHVVGDEVFLRYRRD